LKKIVCVASAILISLVIVSCAHVSSTPTVITTTADTESPITTVPTHILTMDDLLKSEEDVVYPTVIMFGNYSGASMSVWLLDDKTPVFGHASGDKLSIKIYNSHDEPATFSIQYADINPYGYQQGTVSGNVGSIKLTGTNTKWSTIKDLAVKGLIIEGDNNQYQVSKIIDDTHLELTTPLKGTYYHNEDTNTDSLVFPKDGVYVGCFYEIDVYQSHADATGKYYEEAPSDTIDCVKISNPTITIQPHGLATVPFSIKLNKQEKYPQNWEFRLIVTNVTNASQIMTNQAVRVLISMAGS
jgi:hypothetical protein